MNRRYALGAPVALAWLLTGCGRESGTPAASAPVPAPRAVSMEMIEAQARGFSVGSTLSARTAYVFFDAQCPHCAALWESARPLKAKARLVWLPVGLLGDKSVAQGAALLAAPDPVAAMDAHEASMREKRGGIAPAGDLQAQAAVVQANTKLMDSLGFASVPAIVTRGADGSVATREGALPTDELARFLGL